MQIKEVIEHLEALAPTAYAEDFDNIGLLVGDTKNIVTGILVTLDTLENIVDEAIENNCNLIVSFHPIVFKGIKKFNGTNYVERVVIKAIKNDIAIFAIHTALDNARYGVNDRICEQLGLINRKILIPQTKTIKKLVTYAPIDEAEKLRTKLFEAGAGAIGNYNNCSFSSNGTGTFMPTENTNPVIGEIGKIHKEKETRIQVTYPKHKENKILEALFKNHSYEEVAYEITTLENKNQNIGMGMIGELPEAIEEIDFLKHIKKVFNSGCIRHSSLLNKPIKKVAVLGSGVMGTGIACHFANIGLDVLMLDIVPFDLTDEEKKNPAMRNRIVNGSLKAAMKSKPAALYNKKFVSRIKTGNFDDDFEKIARK